MGNDARNREVWLDGLKGFGILLVIFGHVLSGYMDAWTFPDAYWSFYGIRTWIYSFHMPMFFMISGYAFTLAYYRDGRLRREGFLRQLGNLFLVYTVFVLLQWAVKQAVPELVNETYTLEDLLGMFVEPLGNFWYIYVLFIIYVAAAVTGFPRRNPLWLIIPAAAAVWVAEIHLDWTNLTLYRILYHFLFFGAGCMLCRRKNLLKSPKAAGYCWMVLAVMTYLHVFWYIRDWFSYWRVLIALCTAFANMYLFCRWERLARFPLFRICGKYCLELYLLHTFFTGGLRTVLTMWGLAAPWLSVWVNFGISTAASLLIAWLCGKWRWGGILFRPLRVLKGK